MTHSPPLLSPPAFPFINVFINYYRITRRLSKSPQIQHHSTFIVHKWIKIGTNIGSGDGSPKKEIFSASSTPIIFRESGLYGKYYAWGNDEKKRNGKWKKVNEIL